MRSLFTYMLSLSAITAIALINVCGAEEARTTARDALDLSEKVIQQRDTWRDIAGKIADGRLVRPPDLGPCCRTPRVDTCEIDVLLPDDSTASGSTVWCDASKLAPSRWANSAGDWSTIDWTPAGYMVQDCDHHVFELGADHLWKVAISWNDSRHCLNAEPLP